MLQRSSIHQAVTLLQNHKQALILESDLSMICQIIRNNRLKIVISMKSTTVSNEIIITNHYTSIKL